MDHACGKSIRTANTAGTNDNHRTHLKFYLQFCNEYMYQPFPADYWRYCQFGQFLSWQGKKPGTINNYVSTVRLLHKLEGYDTPEPGQIHYNKISNSFKKQRTKPMKQAAPMTHQLLFRIFEHVNLAVELEAMTWTAVLVGFSVILRISDLGPETREKFRPDQHFTKADLEFEDGYWNLYIRWSKTIQYKNRVVKAPVVPSSNRSICPQHWLNRMIKLIPAQSHEPLFLVREGAHRYPLTSGQVNRLLKKWTKLAGLDPTAYTGHCLRRGGLSWAHRAR